MKSEHLSLLSFANLQKKIQVRDDSSRSNLVLDIAYNVDTFIEASKECVILNLSQ